MKIPQVDGVHDSDDSTSDSGSSQNGLKEQQKTAKLIPQYDGHENGGKMPPGVPPTQGAARPVGPPQYGTENMNHQQSNPTSSFYIGENPQSFSGVIPILMPPGIPSYHH